MTWMQLQILTSEAIPLGASRGLLGSPLRRSMKSVAVGCYVDLVAVYRACLGRVEVLLGHDGSLGFAWPKS